MDIKNEHQHESLGVGFLQGGGEMGARMRAFDWSTTPLGPPEGWPAPLQTATRIMLTSRQPMFVWWGPEFVNLYNDAYTSALGARHPSGLGQPARQVWHEIWEQVGPRAESVLSRNEGTFDEDLLLVMERNGYPEETYYTFSYSPVPGAAGGAGGLLGVVIDSTGRVIGERQLALLCELAAGTAEVQTRDDATRLYCAALQRPRPDLPFTLIYTLDRQQNRLDLLGAAALDPQAAGVPRHIDLGASEPAHAALIEALETNAPRVLASLDPLLPAPPAGAWRHPVLQAVAAPLVVPGHQRAAGLLVAGLNPLRLFDDRYRRFIELVAGQMASGLTRAQVHEEERQRLQALSELDRAKTVFFSDISHEFRTPLTLMLAPLEDLLAAPAVGREQGRALRLVHRNARRLLKLVNTLLDFSRIEAGRLQATREPVDLARATTDLATLFQAAVERAGLQLHIDCPPLSSPAQVDPDMWEKIVLNLLSNAFKYTLQGEIAVRLSEQGQGLQRHAVLQVEDTGIGIAADEVPLLFNRFHRVQGAQGRSSEGSGIGLALVQELTRLHGGSVSASSRPGHGSCFEVRLPMGSAALPGAGAARGPLAPTQEAAPYVEEVLRWLPDGGDAGSTPSDAIATSGWLPLAAEPRARLLLCDDNADLRDYLVRLLSRGHDVQAVADGLAALQAVREGAFDLVVSDIMMPGLDGLGLLKALREDHRTSSVPVILLSAQAGEEARLEGLQAGADDYLIKPFSARELVARVDGLLALARLRREAGDALRESEARFRELADHAPMMVWLAEADGRCSYLSRSWSQFTGQPPEAGLGHGWLQMVHPGDRERIAHLQVNDAGSHTTRRAEYRLRRRDGSYAWALDVAQPRFDGSGRWLGYVGSVLDISDRKQAEDALRAADRQKDEFLATLAHELRNPLAPIRNGLELLKRASDRPEVFAKALGMMERQVNHMVRLIDDLLDVSRISRGRISLRRERLDLKGVLAGALETSRPLIEQMQHQFSLDLPAEPLHVDGDATRLTQVFANLLNNAARYTDPGGRIRISVSHDGSEACVVVRDNGIGIAPDQQGRVFEMFAQAPSAARFTEGGLGIGLTIARQLVDMHGGRIDVHSAGLGRGSEFTVHLPLAAAARRATAGASWEPPSLPL
ncbi:ATP-binding protein [Eleftheria terrae]|uniref:ATP-binding protein n=1 Tax=Eleftheria terrae TaxID=1597781 RepID=UPI00263BBE5B|nr:ATP-binding protein [Eleftheria terrae]WKB51700.1 ATP-binding protein [Eleftheria terrae]